MNHTELENRILLKLEAAGKGESIDPHAEFPDEDPDDVELAVGRLEDEERIGTKPRTLGEDGHRITLRKRGQEYLDSVRAQGS